MSNYLSRSAIMPTVSASMLFIKPYNEGVNNFQKALAAGSLESRAKHFGIGCALVIPLVNTIALSILRSQAIKESHFTVEDMKLLTSLNLGMRHVSNRAAAQGEKRNGLKNGCSLGLVPQRCQLTKMNEKGWNQVELHEQAEFVKHFEEGLNQFILKSLEWDVSRVTGPIGLGHTKLEETAKLVNFCTFSIIDYQNRAKVTEVEIKTWGQGLGRFPSNDIDGEHITIIPYVRIEDLGYSKRELQQVIRKTSQVDELERRMIDCYRLNLLQTIRTNFT